MIKLNFRLLRVRVLHLLLPIALILLMQGVMAFDHLSNQDPLDATIKLSMKSEKLGAILNQVEKQTPLRFAYDASEVDITKTILLERAEFRLKQLLLEVSRQSGASFELSKNVITVIPPKQPVALNSDNISTAKDITGKVLNKSGAPVVGATVIVKGKNRGTETDANGSFKIDANEGDVLVVSSVGYESVELTIKNASGISVVLVETEKELADVVVIGYGSVKKRDLTGSVVSVKSSTLANQAKMNDPIQALQGQVAGADITSGNAPGATSSIIIRGYRSLSASNAPLIIVDDAPFGGRLDEINPAEIQSIDILKDASSTAIYGSRGANGVVIITTKRGTRDGKLQIEYDGFYGMAKSLRNFDMMNGPEYAAYREAAYVGVNNPTIFDDVQKRVIASGKYIDWQKEMFSGISTKSNQNVSIGRNRSKLVLGYNNDQGIIQNSSYQRYTARYTNDNQLTRNLSIGYSALITGSVRNFTANEVWRNGTRMDPLSEMYDVDGQMNFYTNTWMRGGIANPIFDTKKENVDVRQNRDRILGNLNAEWKITNHLKARSTVTIDKTAIENGTYFSPFSSNRQLVNSGANYSNQKESQITLTNQLNYSRAFSKHHKLDVSAVNDLQKYSFNTVGVSGFDIPYYGMWYNVNEAQQQVTPSSGKSEWSILSYMGRINYAFKDRYLFTATGRFDGSSRLAQGNKWDFFPSAAFAWRVNEERFLNDARFLSNLKLRLSYGVTGNTSIDPYATQGQFGRVPYSFGTSERSAIGYVPSVISNPDLGWEKTAEANIGLDFGFFNDRISGSLDLYQRDTYDVLMQRNLPTTSGYSSVWQNIGQTRNSGFELALQTVPVSTNNFKWTTNLTLSNNKNQIIELFNGKQDSPGNNWFIGQPFYVERIYKFIGVWQTSEAEDAKKFAQIPGQGKYLDVNGNFKYDAEDLFTYNRIPKWIGGFSSNVQYKGWDFSIYTYARLDYGSRLGVLTYDFGSTRFNHLKGNYWTPTNPSNEQPKPNAVADGLLMASSFAYRDQSFVRIRNINLGFTFPESFLKKIASKGLRAYLALENPYLWTKKEYVGLDPENANSEVDARPLTTLMFGVNLKF